jgi:hypothetical protein
MTLMNKLLHPSNLSRFNFNAYFFKLLNCYSKSAIVFCLKIKRKILRPFDNCLFDFHFRRQLVLEHVQRRRNCLPNVAILLSQFRMNLPDIRKWRNIGINDIVSSHDTMREFSLTGNLGNSFFHFLSWI